MLHVSRWERRDGADWETLVAAASAWCDAVAASDASVHDARLYSDEGQSIVVVVDTDSLDAVVGDVDHDVVRARTRLAQLARSGGTETWFPLAPSQAGVPARTLRETLDLA